MMASAACCISSTDTSSSRSPRPSPYSGRNNRDGDCMAMDSRSSGGRHSTNTNNNTGLVKTMSKNCIFNTAVDKRNSNTRNTHDVHNVLKKANNIADGKDMEEGGGGECNNEIDFSITIPTNEATETTANIGNDNGYHPQPLIRQMSELGMEDPCYAAPRKNIVISYQQQQQLGKPRKLDPPAMKISEEDDGWTEEENDDCDSFYDEEKDEEEEEYGLERSRQKEPPGTAAKMNKSSSANDVSTGCIRVSSMRKMKKMNHSNRSNGSSVNSASSYGSDQAPKRVTRKISQENVAVCCGGADARTPNSRQAKKNQNNTNISDNNVPATPSPEATIPTSTRAAAEVVEKNKSQHSISNGATTTPAASGSTAQKTEEGKTNNNSISSSSSHSKSSDSVDSSSHDNRPRRSIWKKNDNNNNNITGSNDERKDLLSTASCHSRIICQNTTPNNINGGSSAIHSANISKNNNVGPPTSRGLNMEEQNRTSTSSSTTTRTMTSRNGNREKSQKRLNEDRGVATTKRGDSVDPSAGAEVNDGAPSKNDDGGEAPDSNVRRTDVNTGNPHRVANTRCSIDCLPNRSVDDDAKGRSDDIVDRPMGQLRMATTPTRRRNKSIGAGKESSQSEDGDEVNGGQVHSVRRRTPTPTNRRVSGNSCYQDQKDSPLSKEQGFHIGVDHKVSSTSRRRVIVHRSRRSIDSSSNGHCDHSAERQADGLGKDDVDGEVFSANKLLPKVKVSRRNTSTPTRRRLVRENNRDGSPEREEN